MRVKIIQETEWRAGVAQRDQILEESEPCRRTRYVKVIPSVKEFAVENQEEGLLLAEHIPAPACRPKEEECMQQISNWSARWVHIQVPFTSRHGEVLVNQDAFREERMPRLKALDELDATRQDVIDTHALESSQVQPSMCG